jgi:hypothetical protein
MKKSITSVKPVDAFRFVMPDDSSLDEKLLNIYWYKKELDEFLPQLATYSTPQEIASITISQLGIIEKQIIAILDEMSKRDSA